MTGVSPPNHTDALLVHDPAISLDGSRQLNAVREICQKTYNDPNADGSIEIRKILSNIVL